MKVSIQSSLMSSSALSALQSCVLAHPLASSATLGTLWPRTPGSPRNDGFMICHGDADKDVVVREAGSGDRCTRPKSGATGHIPALLFRTRPKTQTSTLRPRPTPSYADQEQPRIAHTRSGASIKSIAHTRHCYLSSRPRAWPSPEEPEQTLKQQHLITHLPIHRAYHQPNARPRRPWQPYGP